MRRLIGLAGLLLCLQAPAQRLEGDLRLQVEDPSGAPLAAIVVAANGALVFRAEEKTDPRTGIAMLRRLPFGPYRIRVQADGFETQSMDVEIATAVPVRRTVQLAVSTVVTEVNVAATPVTVDPDQTMVISQLGRDQLSEAPLATTGRSVVNAVQSLPGWLLEANAVLHPRGSEYDTQYVVDGVALLDNRSINYVPGFETSDLETIHVMTAGIPAEYGRRLGGVIELNSRRAPAEGHHPEFGVGAGSYATKEVFATEMYRKGPLAVTGSARGGFTDRYLDPPTLENYTNRGSSSSGFLRVERDISPSDRLVLSGRASQVKFLVPNEQVQQDAGQRQDRDGRDVTGQAHYQRILSPTAVVAIRGMARDVRAELWSNPFATPVYTAQDRGFREGVVSAIATVEQPSRTLRFGGDFRVIDVNEEFLFAQTGVPIDRAYRFRSSRAGKDASLFIDQQIRQGDLTFRAGVRMDHYRMLVQETAISPRLSMGYYWRQAGILIHAAYDRVFQTPAIENLLLSSDAAGQGLPGIEGFLPVPPSHGNFYEFGVRRSFGNWVRIQATQYWREFENFADDDVFLNTGISLPISFRSARVRGTEARIEMPVRRGFSVFGSYSHMLGTAAAPVTGGLFVRGGEADELRGSSATFAISQDQRNTVFLLARYQPARRLWFSGGFRYGSGLPVELEDDDDDDEDEERPDADRGPARRAAARISERQAGADRDDFPNVSGAILDRVNFERGRVRPNLSLDASVGILLWREENRSVRLQVDGTNLTGRVNLINFAGVFSGTALAPGRMVGMQLRFSF